MVITALGLSACAPTAAESRPLPANIRPLGPATEALARCAFDYLWHEADAGTGIVKDRAANRGSDDYTVGSTAATGFALAALPIGVERGWITPQQAYDRALLTLRFHHDRMPHKNGWFYHFVDARTGQRAWRCEVSSIDTALFLAGALLVGECFPGTEVSRLADRIYQRVDFMWMLSNGGRLPKSRLLCHGWKPERGFLPYRWDTYCEHMLLYLLAMGSPTHPIPAECWDAWERPVGSYAGHTAPSIGPLFVHQYSHAFIDFRGRIDRLGWDYFEASVQATLANRQFCIDQAGKYPGYGEDAWGLSATDGPRGYRAYGAPPGHADHDGTIAPWSMAASIVFTPELCEQSIAHLRNTHGARGWGRYGFPSGINTGRGFWAPEVIGIDVGAALLMIENHRSELIWRLFMRIPAIRQGMEQAGFSAVSKEKPGQAA